MTLVPGKRPQIVVDLRLISKVQWLGDFIHEREMKRRPYKTTCQGGGFNLIPDAYLYFRVEVISLPTQNK